MSSQESYRIRRVIGWGIVGLIVVIGVSIALSAFTSGGRGGFFPFHFGWLGGIFLILVVFWIARWFFWPWGRWGHRPYWQNADDEARNILRARYARGEITKEQYDAMMHDLGQKDT